MQEIIKAIINIDKRAIQKEKECREYQENLDNQRQSRVIELKNKYETRLNQEISEKRSQLNKEIEEESQSIIREGQKQREAIGQRFEKFEERVSGDAFNMILRNLEE